MHVCVQIWYLRAFGGLLNALKENAHFVLFSSWFSNVFVREIMNALK